MIGFINYIYDKKQEQQTLKTWERNIGRQDRQLEELLGDRMSTLEKQRLSDMISKHAFATQADPSLSIIDQTKIPPMVANEAMLRQSLPEPFKQPTLPSQASV